jgi:hypothetical protein
MLCLPVRGRSPGRIKSIEVCPRFSKGEEAGIVDLVVWMSEVIDVEIVFYIFTLMK